MAHAPAPRPTLGELMKTHEHAWRRRVQPTDYVLLRLDGKAFHSYTKGLAKPFDSLLMAAMDRTLVTLCEQVQSVRMGYVESDEISLLLTAFRDVEPSDSNPAGRQTGELWMGGVEAKLLSLSAAIATATFNQVRMEQFAQLGEAAPPLAQFHRSPALFDARMWTFPGTEEGRDLVKKYFAWRRRDSIKNSVTMAALDAFSHRAIHGMKTEEKIEKLRTADRAWEDLPAGFRFGRAATREVRRELVTFTHGKTGEAQSAWADRSFWATAPFEIEAEWFTGETLPAPPLD